LERTHTENVYFPLQIQGDPPFSDAELQKKFLCYVQVNMVGLDAKIREG
jgi:hypothetical protein